ILSLELKESRVHYIVDRSLSDELGSEVVPKRIYTVCSRDNSLSLWPIKLLDQNGGLDDWSQSAHQAAIFAMQKSVKIVSNRPFVASETFEATGDFPEPDWGDHDFLKLLELGFKDRIITSVDHPVVQVLKGWR